MTPIEHMRRSVAKFQQSGQMVELSHAHAWATIAIAEHLEGACHAQEKPAAADTAELTKPSAKRGRRTSQPDKSPAAAAPTSSNPDNVGNSTTPTTEPATSDQHTNAATTQPAHARATPNGRSQPTQRQRS